MVCLQPNAWLESYDRHGSFDIKISGSLIVSPVLGVFSSHYSFCNSFWHGLVSGRGLMDPSLIEAPLVRRRPPWLLVSSRSPWSNQYEPALDDGAMPSERLRKLEIDANTAFDQYREMYFEGGVSSVYLWDLDHGFAGQIFLIPELLVRT